MPSIGRRRLGAVSPTPPVSRLHVPTERAVVDCGVYVDGVREQGRFTHRAAIRRVRDTGQGFVWIGLHAPDQHQMESLSREFGLHELITEDATSGDQRPKLEAYDGILVLNMSTVSYLAHESVTEASDIVSTGEVMVVLGRDFVVTIRHGEFGGLAGIREELERAPERLLQGPAAVMHAVADRVVDSYLEAAEGMSRDVDELESGVFAPRTPVDIEQIYFLKRELLELKHNISPLVVPLRRLAGDHLGMVPSEIRHYFRDVQDHHSLVTAQVATLDEQVTSLVHAAVAIVGMRQNTDMRRISAWVAIAAVPTMIAGVYGMNFDHMPELRMEYGYFLVLGFMLTACGGLFLLFRKNSWL
ncbi:MAG TPA: magnesium and cobalt transport protein CorA [Dietzia sp.]|nr:magnesium and cobalt transport protein CorA [Dietzia sp.]